MMHLLCLHYAFWLTLFGTCCIGIVAGAIGTITLLRRQSLLGDTISHAALPGIALAFLITKEQNTYALLIGGILAGCLSGLLLLMLKKSTTLKIDTILGIILSAFFGIGLILVTLIQKNPTINQTMINKFFFGNASILLLSDIKAIIVISGLIMVFLLVTWKELKLLTFDADFAQTLGYSTALLDLLVTLMMVITIVIGLHTVGVILMSSLLIAPAAAARQWTRSVHTMMFLASIIGGISALIGTFISYSQQALPTGPIIVIIISCIVAFSFAVAPKRTAHQGAP